VPPDGRSRVPAAALLASRRRDDVHGRRRVHGGPRAARGADHSAGCGAPACVPARRLVGALVDRRGHRGAGAHPGPRAAGAAGPLRALRHAAPAVARPAAHRRGPRLGHLAGVPGFWLGVWVAVRGRGRRVRALLSTARRM
jgi:hypothetical protein